jgi:hypothetical protein
VESELGAAGRELEVPSAGDVTAAVRRRLDGEVASRRRVPAAGTGVLRLRLGWSAALVLVVAFLAALIATPQGRAVISHVFRFAGVEVRQGPGQAGELSTLAEQTGLFYVLFGPNAGVPAQAPPQLRTPPPEASLGPRYTIIYTVPGGIISQQQVAQVRQDLYPGAAAGPLVYTPPPGQHSGPFPVSGWLRASHGLPSTLARLGIPPPGTQAAPQTRLRAAHPAAAQVGSRALPWLIASAAAIGAVALAGTVLLLRRRRPATAHDTQPRTSGPAAGSA